MTSTTRHKIVPAAYLVLTQNDHIALLRRCNTGYCDGQYSLIAGHVEFEESFIQALIRESQEEGNIILSEKDLEVVHIMQRKENKDPPEIRDRIDVFIRAHRWSGELQNVELHKCDELKWYPLSSLPHNIIPYVKTALENIAKGIFYSEIGYTEINET